MSNVRTCGLLCAALLCLSACTSHIAHSPYIKDALVREDYDAALARIEKIGKRSSRLLYLYEKGLVLHYQNRFEDSNAVLDEAEFLYDELYTKSLSREVVSLLTSDNVVKYRGEQFEAALIHYYKLLNYLHSKQSESALVECRKLNILLQQFADDEDSPNPENPFLQYLTGMVYQANGEYNDAGVSFRVALEGYRRVDDGDLTDFPNELYCDLAANARAMHDLEEAKEYQALCNRSHADQVDAVGTLNLFLECGYVPHKIENNIVIPLYKDERDHYNDDDYADELYYRYDRPRDHDRKLDYLLRVAIPELVSDPASIPEVRARVSADSKVYAARASTMDNVGGRAVRAFDARRGKIILKTIARGLAKYLSKKGLEDKDKVAGWLLNALNVATESADTRSWSTLPQSIRLSRLELPEGVYDVEIELYDPWGERDERFVIPAVTITAGEPTFLNYRIY